MRKPSISPLHVIIALLAIAFASMFMLPVPASVPEVTSNPTPTAPQESAYSGDRIPPLVQPDRSVCSTDVRGEQYFAHYPTDADLSKAGLPDSYPHKESKYAAGPSVLPGKPMTDEDLLGYLKRDLTLRMCADEALVRMVTAGVLDERANANSSVAALLRQANIDDYLGVIDWSTASVVEMPSPVGSWTAMMVDDAFGVPQIRVVQITEPRPSHYLKMAYFDRSMDVPFYGPAIYLRLECGYQPLYWDYKDIPETLRP